MIAVRPRRRSWLLAAGLAVVASAACVPPAVAGDGGVGFRPHSEAGSTLDGGFLVLRVAPGGRAAGSFVMTNSRSEPANVAIYPADGLTGATTGIVYGGAGEPLRRAGSWLTPDARSAILGARSERVVTFTVHVPDGTPPGDHVGSVVLQQSATGDGPITQILRSVVPVFVEVAGPAARSLAVEGAGVGVAPGSRSAPAVTVTMRNTGRRICRPRLSVALDGGAERGAPVSRQLDAILPGDTVPYVLRWPRELQAGRYTVTAATSDCGEPRSTSAPAEWTAPGAPGVGAPAAPSNPPAPAGNVTTPPRGGSGSTDRARPRRTRSAPVTPRRDPDASTRGAGPAVATPGAAAGSEGWLDKVRDAIREHAVAVLTHATVPLAVIGLLLLLFFVQEAIDRRDPKLALAPVHREPDLGFDPDPLGTVGPGLSSSAHGARAMPTEPSG